MHQQLQQQETQLAMLNKVLSVEEGELLMITLQEYIPCQSNKKDSC
jgi:hypothetical protein